MTSNGKKPVVLIVRDGWGANPDPSTNANNAVHLAQAPVDDRLMAEYPHVQVITCGTDVGLPPGVMGNSEVGHQNIGAGRIVEQELMRITGRIQDGSFFDNQELKAAFESAGSSGGKVHILGLCSDGQVHSDLEHLEALLEFATRSGFPGNRLFVHAITDGRDTAPNAGRKYVARVEEACRKHGINPVASVIGRFYAMDRDNRWERVETAYRLLTERIGTEFESADAAIEHAYQNPPNQQQAGDEFIQPSVMTGLPGGRASIDSGDAVILFNFRGDRPRELTKAFVYDTFPFVDDEGTRHGFERPEKVDVHFTTMTAYEAGLPVHVAFPKPPRMKQILGQYVSESGRTQFRCAETEKYPHVTFFFNDYRDEPFPGEERQIVPSPRDISTYDQKPEMSAHGVTDAVLERIEQGSFDLIVVNYANGDMVGHTGSLPATISAIEVVDDCVGKLCDATLAKGGALIVTADHGNAEQMISPETGGPHTAHTTFPVELILVDNDRKGSQLRTGGRLADIAPTILELLGLEKPPAMTGSSLLGNA
ncbi:MAG: 2,3-bisphosphoglycerate-independent phosphoglycerate mutase [Phycisphaerae bacterium]